MWNTDNWVLREASLAPASEEFNEGENRGKYRRSDSVYLEGLKAKLYFKE